MAFFLALAYAIITYLSPARIFPALVPYNPMVWLAVAAGIATVLHVVSGQTSLRAPQLYLMVGFIGSIALSAFITSGGWFTGTLNAIVGFSAMAIVFFLFALTAGTLTRLRILTLALALLALYFTFRGMAAYHFGYDAETYLTFPTEEDEEGRLVPRAGFEPRIRGVGIAEDPNDLAQLLLLGMPFLGLSWRKGRLPWNLLLVVLPILILLYGLYLTRSRGGIIGLAFLCGFAVKDRVKPVFSLIAGILIVAGLLALDFAGGREVSLQEGSAAARVEAWSSGLMMLKSSPIWGVGWQNFTEHHERTAHNSFVLCFAELGLLGYFFWMALIVFSTIELNALVKLPRTEPVRMEVTRWARAVQLAFFSFLVTSWFLSRTYVLTLYVLLGLIVALVEIERRHSKSRLPQPTVVWAWATLSTQFASIVLVYIFARIRFF